MALFSDWLGLGNVENGCSFRAHKLLSVLFYGNPSKYLHALLALLDHSGELFPCVESKDILSWSDLLGRDSSLAETLDNQWIVAEALRSGRTL